jgi:Uma2 family endonuclease
MNTQAVEIIETEVVLEEVWSLNHSRVMHRLGMALLSFADRYDILPELEFELAAGRLKPNLALLPCLTYNWDADVLRYPHPPITVMEILTPTQALDAVITKIRQYYFTSGVQSAWLVVPIVQHIYLFLPGQPLQVITEGILRDPAAQVEVALADIFR